MARTKRGSSRGRTPTARDGGVEAKRPRTAAFPRKVGHVDGQGVVPLDPQLEGLLHADDRHAEDVQAALHESIREDLGDLIVSDRIELGVGAPMPSLGLLHERAIRSRAAHRRAEVQVRKLLLARGLLLLAGAELNNAVRACASTERVSEALAHMLFAIETAFDIEGSGWALCHASCGHFLFEHRREGGCVHPAEGTHTEKCQCPLAGTRPDNFGPA